EGQRQLDRAEVRAEVTTGVGDRAHDEVTDLAAQLCELLVRQVVQVARFTDGVERHMRDRPYPSDPARTRRVTGNGTKGVRRANGGRGSLVPIATAAPAPSRVVEVDAPTDSGQRRARLASLALRLLALVAVIETYSLYRHARVGAARGTFERGLPVRPY